MWLYSEAGGPLGLKVDVHGLQLVMENFKDCHKE